MKRWLVSLACVAMTATMAFGQYVVDFEGDGEVKGGYASGTVSLSGMNWDMTEAAIGTLDGDWKNGVRSARMRGYAASAMTMLEDLAGGVGTLSFGYRRYGTDPQVDWKVEYSTDGGTSWTQIGSDFTAPDSDVVQTFSETVNSSGNTRIRIKRATESGGSNARLNIDDITMTSGGPAVFGVTFDQTEGFEVEQGTSEDITATAANGVAPYSYSWETSVAVSDYSHNDNVFTIAAAAATGSFWARVVATDSDTPAKSVTNTINFSVVMPPARYPITVTPPVNGSVTTTPETEAEAGQTVTINATPAGGYAVDTITVVESDMTPVALTGNTFTMPADSVTVTVAFQVFEGSNLIISEVADPGDNASQGRFVELYNAGDSSIDLAAGQWFLSKQVNGGTTWNNIALTGTVAPGATYVVAGSTNFPTAYPLAPAYDLYNGSISGNGDDGYFLYSGGNRTEGTLEDAYGVIDQDGTGTPWEYEDARAVRNTGVTVGNPEWTASEWTITDPANVADMTPGVHPDGPLDFSVSFNKADGFVIEEGAEDAITAIAANGAVPYSYEWVSTLTGTHYEAIDEVFTILATAPIGDYTATVTVTDNDSAEAANTINFSVVAPTPKYAITITPPVNGTVTTTPATEAEAGQTVTINATPADGYAVESMIVNSGAVSVNGNTFVMPAGPASVTVTFMVFEAPDVLITFEDGTLSGSYVANTAQLEDGKVWSTMRVVNGNLENDKKIGTLSARLYPQTGTNAVLEQTEAYAEPITRMSFWVASYGTDNMANVVLTAEVSTDGTTWEVVKTLTAAAEITATLVEHVVDTIPANAVYARFVATASAVSGKRINIDNVGFDFGAASPSLTYTGATTVTLGQAFNLVFTLHNATASGWQYLLESASREELDTGDVNTFNWAPSHTGTYYLTMTALDEASDPIATREVVLTVNPVGPDDPEVTITGDLTGPVDEAMNLVIALINSAPPSDWILDLEDPDGAAVYVYNWNPATGAFSFTPSTSGTYVLTATAVDGSMATIASKVQDLLVSGGGESPPIPAITFVAGTGLQFDLSAGHAVSRMEAAGTTTDANGEFIWSAFTDYTVNGSTVTIDSEAGAAAQMIRVYFTP